MWRWCFPTKNNDIIIIMSLLLTELGKYRINPYISILLIGSLSRNCVLEMWMENNKFSLNQQINVCSFKQQMNDGFNVTCNVWSLSDNVKRENSYVLTDHANYSVIVYDLNTDNIDKVNKYCAVMHGLKKDCDFMILGIFNKDGDDERKYISEKIVEIADWCYEHDVRYEQCSLENRLRMKALLKNLLTKFYTERKNSVNDRFKQDFGNRLKNKDGRDECVTSLSPIKMPPPPQNIPRTKKIQIIRKQ